MDRCTCRWSSISEILPHECSKIYHCSSSIADMNKMCSISNFFTRIFLIRAPYFNYDFLIIHVSLQHICKEQLKYSCCKPRQVITIFFLIDLVNDPFNEIYYILLQGKYCGQICCLTIYYTNNASKYFTKSFLRACTLERIFAIHRIQKNSHLVNLSWNIWIQNKKCEVYMVLYIWTFEIKFWGY